MMRSKTLGLLVGGIALGSLAVSGCSSGTSASKSASPTSTTTASSTATPTQSASATATSAPVEPVCTKAALQGVFGNVKIEEFTCGGSGGAYYAAIRYENEQGVKGVSFAKAEGTKWSAPITKGLCGSQTAESWPAKMQAYCK